MMQSSLINHKLIRHKYQPTYMQKQQLISKMAPASLGDKVFKGLADLIKLLPSGTVFLFQFLGPLLTNKGHCSTINKYLTGVLLSVCSFSCCFSSFTDSYVDPDDGKVYYGIVTAKGMWLLSYPSSKKPRGDMSKYKLRLGDFAHAGFSLLVFAVIAFLDDNTVSCYYPSLASESKTLLTVMPTLIGGLASVIFMLFPDDRNEIGYPPRGASTIA